MANILVLGVKVPFTSGGQELLVSSLVRELRLRGHTVDVVELPYHVNSRLALLEQARAWSKLDLRRFAGLKVDLVIATKFPSYFTTHPCKSLWLVHQHRPIYDLFGTQFSDFSDDPRSEALRRLLMQEDRAAISACSVIAGISQNVIDRLWEFNALEGEVLYPPLPCGKRYFSDSEQPYILSVGRICRIKRLDLLVKALPQIDSQIKLKVVGQPDDPEFFDYLNNEIIKHHLQQRVEFLGRVPDDALLKLFAQALLVYYAPFDEDYGFVSLEAMASSKPVLACSDSGGILEFVKHLETGFVVDPVESAVSEAVNRLIGDLTLRQQLGEGGRKLIETSGLLETGWDAVVGKLLAPLQAASANSGDECFSGATA